MARADITPGEDWVDGLWFGGGALHLARPGDYFALVALRGEDRSLQCWYVNLQLPITRTALGVDTMDLILDVVVSPDLGDWSWKDEDQFQDALDRDILTAQDAELCRSAGIEAIDRLRSSPGDNAYWATWMPPEDWSAPSLPDGWDVP